MVNLVNVQETARTHTSVAADSHSSNLKCTPACLCMLPMPNLTRRRRKVLPFTAVAVAVIMVAVDNSHR